MSHRNQKDVETDISDQVREEVEFKFVRTIEEALEEVWGSEIWVGTSGAGTKGEEKEKVEARL